MASCQIYTHKCNRQLLLTVAAISQLAMQLAAQTVSLEHQVSVGIQTALSSHSIDKFSTFFKKIFN